MKKTVTILMVLALLAVSACTEYQTRGGLTGGAIGGIAGALLDHRNPWRGGIIGAGIGALAGVTIAEISNRGSREAYTSGRPVEYYTEDRRGRYYAEPMDYDERTKCRKVRERVWEDGRLVKDQVREICESTSYDRRY
jgi:hypothetical protein